MAAALPPRPQRSSHGPTVTSESARETQPCSVAHPVTRRERQHIEVITLALSGDRDRAAVLGREHLREFPDDVLVAQVLASRGLA